MGYSTNETIVRVDRFKERGKWYESLAVDMGAHYEASSIHDAVRASILQAYPTIDRTMIYVCLEPYHKHSHPVMLKGL